MGKKAIGPRVRGTLITLMQVDQHSIKLTSKHLYPIDKEHSQPSLKKPLCGKSMTAQDGKDKS